MAEGNIVKPREIVKANNELFRCKYKIKDVVAGRIFMAFASVVDHDSVKENDSFVEYQITASSIMQEIDAGGDYYDQLKSAVYSLIGHRIEQQFDNKNFALYTLFSKIEYRDGILKGQFHKDLIPFFIIAREKFTKMKLYEYMQLPSIYSQSIFGLLKSWSDKKYVTIKLSDLHTMLDTPQSFRKDFYNFKARVLEKAHKDINEKTSLAYEWEPIKNGRSFSEIKFKFIKKKKVIDVENYQKMNTAKQSLAIEHPKNIAKPKFDAFLTKFSDGKINHLNAGIKWYRLYNISKAPLAEDVQDNNNLGVIEFLTKWEIQYT